jgi:hypothetical protein
MAATRGQDAVRRRFAVLAVDPTDNIQHGRFG